MAQLQNLDGSPLTWSEAKTRAAAWYEREAERRKSVYALEERRRREARVTRDRRRSRAQRVASRLGRVEPSVAASRSA